MKKILVIKLGALGDFITALGPMRAIRTHHPDDRLMLLTTKPFEKMGRDCGIFDDVWLDTRPKWHNLSGWAALRTRLNTARFDRVYDLQNNDRTELYLKLMSPKPEWVGAARGASHRNTSPDRTAARAYDGHVQTLGLAGITNIAPDQLEWMTSDTTRFALTPPYVLLVPGCSPQHPRKRWPIDSYRTCAKDLMSRGYQVIVIGGPPEADTNAQLAQDLPVLNLTGQTQLYDIAALARGAAGAIGNDTGPSHMIAVSNCPIVVLYCSQESSIRKHGPLGTTAKAIEVQDLNELEPATVLSGLAEILRKG